MLVIALLVNHGDLVLSWNCIRIGPSQTVNLSHPFLFLFCNDIRPSLLLFYFLP